MMTSSYYFKYERVEDAQQKLLSLAGESMRRVEMLDVRDAIEYVLAEDIHSERDIPQNDIAHFDGYAIRSEDTKLASLKNPLRFKIVKEIKLTEQGSDYEISSGEVIYVPTGCELPQNADAIVPVESVKREGDYIILTRPIAKGFHVIHKGSDIRKNELVLRKGTVILGQHIKVLLDSGIFEVPVYKKPRVVVMPIGSELTNDSNEHHKKLETHSYLISYLIEKNGGIAMQKAPIPDDPILISKEVEEALENYDIIVTIGGASVGKMDFTWNEAKRIRKPRLEIRGIKVHPGRVTSVVLFERPIIMLPGLIQSTLSGTIFILLPLIRFLAGLSPSPLYPKFVGRVKSVIKIPEYKPFKRVRFVKRIESISNEKGKFIDLLRYESFHSSVLLKADGIIIIPENIDEISPNETLTIYGVYGLF